jgi:hypothetical protein
MKNNKHFFVLKKKEKKGKRFIKRRCGKDGKI